MRAIAAFLFPPPGQVYAVGPQYSRSRARLGSLRSVKSSGNVLAATHTADVVPSPDNVARVGRSRRQSLPSVPSWGKTGAAVAGRATRHAEAAAAAQQQQAHKSQSMPPSARSKAKIRRGTSWKTPRMEAGE